MKIEQIVFLNVLKDFIHNNPTMITQNIDWNILGQYAKKHQVEGIFYYQTKKNAFLKAYGYQLYHYTMITEEIKKISVFLNDVRYFIVKGPEVARFYPVPQLRSMGDVDYIVDDKKQVAEKLEGLGFRQIDCGLTEIAMVNLKNVHIELHDKLLYDEIANDTKQAKFINDYWDNINEGHLENNFHFIYLILHLRKHFINSGIGFRQFLDIAMMEQYGNLDWEWIKIKCEEIDLMPFLLRVLTFIDKWFDIESPISSVEIEDEFFEVSTEKIFEDGVFGFDNAENLFNVAAYRNKKKGLIGSIFDLLRYIFIPYAEVIKEKKYEYMEGRKVLMPFFWIYRISTKFGSSKQIKRAYFTNAIYQKKRDIFLKKWGL